MTEEQQRLNLRGCTFFQENLFAPEGEPTRTYLKNRGFDRDAAIKWRIGLAPEDRNALVKTTKSKSERDGLKAVGLVKEGRFGDYDAFSSRLMFPIWNEDAVMIGFGARALSDEQTPKYLNTAETDFYKKSEVLYGIHFARESIKTTGEVYICEGYTDVIRMHEHGFTNAVAPCGTALTEQQVQLLISLGAQRFVLLYDGDAAGIKAAKRSSELILTAGANGVVVSIDKGEDPDTYLKEHGLKGFCRKLASGKLLFTYLIRQAIVEAKAKSRSEIEIKTEASNTILPLLKILSEGERNYHIERIADYLGFSTEYMKQQYDQSVA